VTDSNAAFQPISSSYFGTSCAVAFTTVTSGGGMAGAAACPLLRLHAAVINSAAAANTGSPARENGLLVNVLVILILQNAVVLCRSAERRKYLK
jgi:hypothetical protein